MNTQKAFKRFWANSFTSREIAELVGVSRQAVEMWQDVPAEYVRLLERKTGVPRYVIRPDLYPRREYRWVKEQLDRDPAKGSGA